MSDSGTQSDGEDFPAFYFRFMPNLVGFIMLLGAQLFDAAAIAQETMESAYNHWEEIEKPESWARTIAANNFRRRRKSSRGATYVDVTDGMLLLASSIDPVEWASQHEILRLLSQLPGRQREVMAWTLVGYSPSEIARELEISAKAVLASLEKARRALSDALSMGSPAGEGADG
jgi:RNA polymerase sigma factor (sigma-70 family)